MFCPNCKTEYVDGVTVCDDCGAQLVNDLPASSVKAQWGFSQKTGKLGKAAFLTHCSCVNMENKMLISKLEAYGIPAIEYMPKNGAFGKVVLGISGEGSDIYVPEDMLEKAKSLLGGSADE